MGLRGGCYHQGAYVSTPLGALRPAFPRDPRGGNSRSRPLRANSGRRRGCQDFASTPFNSGGRWKHRFHALQLRRQWEVCVPRVEGPPSFRAAPCGQGAVFTPIEAHHPVNEAEPSAARAEPAEAAVEGAEARGRGGFAPAAVRPLHALQLRRQMGACEAAAKEPPPFRAAPCGQGAVPLQGSQQMRVCTAQAEDGHPWGGSGPEGSCVGQILSAWIDSRTPAAEWFRAARSSSSRL
jgi:hypothetical protein